MTRQRRHQFKNVARGLCAAGGESHARPRVRPGKTRPYKLCDACRTEKNAAAKEKRSAHAL